MTVHEQESWRASAQESALQASRNPQRARQERWDKLHMKTVSARLTMDEHRRFFACCRAARVTRYQAIRYMVMRFTAEIEKGGFMGDNYRIDEYAN